MERDGSTPLIHGLIQKAKLDAETFSIKPDAQWGVIVWHRTDSGWIALARMADQSQAEEFICDKLRKLVE